MKWFTTERSRANRIYMHIKFIHHLTYQSMMSLNLLNRSPLNSPEQVKSEFKVISFTTEVIIEFVDLECVVSHKIIRSLNFWNHSH